MSSAYSPRTAIVAVSKPGATLARRLASNLPGAELHLERKLVDPSENEAQPYDLPLRPVLQNLFVNRDALIVFLPIGAAVRLLAPVFAGKKRDPAVVCVDDAGRYAISVLSGHVGGADELARQVAVAIGAQPIITSASDALNVTAIDLVGRERGWRIEASPTDLTRAAAAVVNRDPVALWLDPATGAAWPDDAPVSPGMAKVDSLAEAISGRWAATLIVSDRLLPTDAGHPVILYRPPTLVAGVGCRRGVEMEHLRTLLDDTLKEHGLGAGSVAKIATADIKADEPGIIALAESLGVPLEIYTADQLNMRAIQAAASTLDGGELSRPTPSAAQDLLGVFGVSEPAAMLASDASGLLAPRTKSDRATIAVARIPARPGMRSAEAQAMTAHEQEISLPGERLLAAAEREIDEGNLRRGAKLVWQAVMEALAPVAERHGMPCGNAAEARLLVKYLDQMGAIKKSVSANSDPHDVIVPSEQPTAMPTGSELARFWHQLRFDLADSFREHYEDLEGIHGTEFEWEPDEYAIFLEPVRSLIQALNHR